MIDFKIRDAIEADFKALHNFLVENEIYAGDFDDIKDNFIVAIYDGKLVGSASHKDHETVVEIRSVGVDKNYRRRDIATGLCRAKMKSLKEAGVKTVYSRVRRIKVPANNLFLSLGFTLTGEEVYDFFPRCDKCKGEYEKMGEYCRNLSPDKKCPYNFYIKHLNQPRIN
jgi:N-acetylglutamate synthase-like GNAT family acetyltransferase